MPGEVCYFDILPAEMQLHLFSLLIYHQFNSESLNLNPLEKFKRILLDKEISHFRLVNNFWNSLIFDVLKKIFSNLYSKNKEMFESRFLNICRNHHDPESDIFIFNLFLKMAININVRDDHDETALILATKSNKPKIVELILNSIDGFELNKQFESINAQNT